MTEAVEGRIVVFASGSKGGVGKSAATVNLAGALAHKGFRVAIVDTDTGIQSLGSTGNQSCSTWCNLRKFRITEGEDLNPISCFTFYPEHKINAELTDIRKNYDYVIVDTPGDATQALRSAAVLADIIYLPINCSATEYLPLINILNLLVDIESMMTLHYSDYRINARVLPSRIPTNWRIDKSEFYDWYQHNAQHISSISKLTVPFLKSICDSLEQGLSLHDIKDPKRAVFDYIVREVQGTLEPVLERRF